MKLDRKEILKALETISVAGEGKNMVESGAVQNVITFGDEVVVDLTLATPALHIKKRAEVDIMKVIHELVYEKAKIALEENKEVNIGNITIESNANTIETVSIVKERSTIEQKADRKVVTIGKDLIASGTTVAASCARKPSTLVPSAIHSKLTGFNACTRSDAPVIGCTSVFKR